VGAPGERFLANMVRRLFDMEGVPLRLHIRCVGFLGGLDGWMVEGGWRSTNAWAGASCS